MFLCQYLNVGSQSIHLFLPQIGFVLCFFFVWLFVSVGDNFKSNEQIFLMLFICDLTKGISQKVQKILNQSSAYCIS